MILILWHLIAILKSCLFTNWKDIWPEKTTATSSKQPRRRSFVLSVPHGLIVSYFPPSSPPALIDSIAFFTKIGKLFAIIHDFKKTCFKQMELNYFSLWEKILLRSRKTVMINTNVLLMTEIQVNIRCFLKFKGKELLTISN